MPYQTVWVDPERFLEHRGVTVFHTYKEDDLDQGINRFEFTVNPRCSSCDPRCDQADCHHVFCVHDLATWIEPPHPPYCTGVHDTQENRAAWEGYWDIERQAIQTAIRAAIDSGELTTDGHVPSARPAA